jgi:exodeoxyribonuclease V gamma subunit
VLVATVGSVLISHRSSRGDLLVDQLAHMLAVASGDPFSPEIVAVPSRGVERWLTQRLSGSLGASEGRHDGVCANVEFPFPAALVGGALAAASGINADTDPWQPDRAVWPLLDVVEDALDEPWLRTLAAHLGRRDGAGGLPADSSRRWASIRHLADLYDRYGVHRPSLIRSWAAGDDVDAEGNELPSDFVWQAILWRRVREHLGVPSPAERLIPACAALRNSADLVDLPARVSVFGLTRLSASYLDVLGALAAHREVHLWLLHPSQVRWERSMPGVRGRSIGPRRRDLGAELGGHPLLNAWGRDAAEMQQVLSSLDAPSATEESFPVTVHPDSLLGRVQADIRADRDSRSHDGLPPTVLAPDDRSLQVHACHGRARQVEVLREVILGLLEDDPTLEPRDIIVMCPDIDTFAPLISATFGPGQDIAGRDLHVRLADRSLRQTNPVLTVISDLLELASGRISASALIDFAGAAPVRRRFGFDDDDLSRIEDWVRASGVRWGLDAADRQRYKLGAIATGTWQAGLDRLLLGVAMSEDDLRVFHGVLPFDDLGSGEVELVGRLSELVDRLAAAIDRFRRPADGQEGADGRDGADGREWDGRQSLDHWLAAISAAADDLTATEPGEGAQRHELQAVLQALVSDAGVGDRNRPPRLSLGEVRSLLARRLEGRPTRANFRTGHLTMCTLVPMRSVPHRVVCLLGLDDGVFPRHPAIDGDDLLERDPWTGDRDARTEDRQLLLDALLAATEHLIITYAGRSERTNALRPPAVPVGELLEVVDAMAVTHCGDPARAQVVVEHPLQSWDARNFVAGGIAGERPWSFDRIALGGARAASGPRSAVPAFGAELSADRTVDPIELDDLVRFVQHPAKAFLQQRLGLRLPEEGEDAADVLPIDLVGLPRWQIGDRLLAARLAGADRDACRAAEMARGTLPPWRLGEEAITPLLDDVDALVDVAGRQAEALSALDVTIDLGRRTVVGTVPDLLGDELCTVTFSNLGPKHRLAAWVRLLALSAADPDRPWRARSVGRGPRRTVTSRVVGPLGADPALRHAEAVAELSAIVDLYDRGRRGPLPLFCRTSEAWASAARRGRSPLGAARRLWVTEAGSAIPSEDRDMAHRLVYDGVATFEDLVSMIPSADESGPGWAPEEPTRVGRLARRLWDPLLAREMAG